MSSTALIAVILIIFVVIVGALLIGAIVFYFLYPMEFEGLMERWFGKVVALASPRTPNESLEQPNSPKQSANTSLRSNQTQQRTETPSKKKIQSDSTMRQDSVGNPERVGTEEYIVGVGDSTIPDPKKEDDSLSNLWSTQRSVTE